MPAGIRHFSMKKGIPVLLVFCFAIAPTVRYSCEQGERLTPPSFSKPQNGGFSLKTLVQADGKLMWSDKTDQLEPSSEGYYYVKGIFPADSSDTQRIICEHCFGNTAAIVADIENAGDTVIGAIGWHDRYYLAERAANGEVFLRELGERPILSERVRYHDFIEAAYRYSSNSSDDLVSGGNGLMF